MGMAGKARRFPRHGGPRIRTGMRHDAQSGHHDALNQCPLLGVKRPFARLAQWLPTAPAIASNTASRIRNRPEYGSLNSRIIRIALATAAAPSAATTAANRLIPASSP